ncbi:hypothetical protein Tco_0762915 [Tanacetum coccineum]
MLLMTRQPGPTMAHRVDYSLVDTMETRFRGIERRMMTALEMVNIRVSYQDLARSEAYCRALEARVTVLETEDYTMEWMYSVMSISVLVVCSLKWHQNEPQGNSSTPAPTTTTTTVTEAQLQVLIDQGVAAAMAEAEASIVKNDYASNGSGPRPAQAVRECAYSEFPKCKPLDFKGTEGTLSVLTDGFAKWSLCLALANCTALSSQIYDWQIYKTMLLHGGNAHVKNHYFPEAAHAMHWANT